MSNTTTLLDAFLKELYTGQKLEHLTLQDQRLALYNMLKKNTKFGGRIYPVPVNYGDPAAGIATFTTAQTNASAMKSEAFEMDVRSHHGVVNFSGDLYDRMRGDKTAFGAGAKTIMDAGFRNLMRKIHTYLYGDGSGVIGQLASSSSFSDTVITLANRWDAVKFQVGMELVFADTTAAAPKWAGRSIGVVAVNHAAGTITVDEDMEDRNTTEDGLGAAEVADGDYIFEAGNYTSAGSRLVLSGLRAWIPATASLSTSFYGVNQTLDRSKLAGTYKSLTSMDVEDAIIQLAAELSTHANIPADTVVCHTSQFGELSKESTTRQDGNTAGPKQGAGATYITVYTDMGAVKVYPDPFCPHNEIFMFPKDQLEILSAGPTVQVYSPDGLMVRMRDAADQIEARLVSRSNLVCKTPNNIARGIVDAVS